VLEQRDLVTQVTDRPQTVRDDDDRLPGRAHVVDLLQAALLELRVAHCEHFVDEEDVGIDVDRDREPESYVHARRVVLHRRVDELLDAGEADDLVEPRVELLLAQPEDGAVEVDVLPSRELGMESGAQLEQRGDLAVRGDPPVVGAEDPGHALQHRALA
jgi:hypothetical protein